MKIRTKAMTIGLFTVLSAVIFFVLIFLFASQDELSTKRSYIMRFTGNMRGLHVGSSVEYRGVKVGEVSKIQLVFDPLSDTTVMPVWIQFLDRLVVGRDQSHEISKRRLKMLVKRGARAQLQSSSILTGEQHIALVFKPDTPIKYYYKDQLEIPTIASSGSQEKLEKTLDAANKTLQSITATMKTANSSLTKINSHIEPTTTQLDNLLVIWQKAGYNFGVLTEYLSRHPESFILGKHKGT